MIWLGDKPLAFFLTILTLQTNKQDNVMKHIDSSGISLIFIITQKQIFLFLSINFFSINIPKKVYIVIQCMEAYFTRK